MKNYKTISEFTESQMPKDYAAILELFKNNPNTTISGGGGGMNRKDLFQLSGLDTFVPDSNNQTQNNATPRVTLLATTSDGRRLAMRQFAGITYDASIKADEQLPSPTNVAQSIEFVEHAKASGWWFLVLDRQSENRTARDGRTFARTILKLMVFKTKPTDKAINDAVTAALAAA